MDIPSVRFQPVPEQAQAAITSTQGHPRLIWPVRPKFNNNIEIIKRGTILKNRTIKALVA